MKIRLNKWLADKGVCSRRKADALIADGKVSVNGKPAELGMRIDPESDSVRVNGKEIGSEKGRGRKPVYLALYKPRGYVCTARRFRGEKNIFSLVRPHFSGRLFSVGRLDKESEGLLLLTNDGSWTHRMSHPRFESEKEYEVWVHADFCNRDEICTRALRGVQDGEDTLRVSQIELVGNRKARIVLREGKKRHIRRLFSALGYRVVRLRRVRVGNIRLGDLRPGEWKNVKPL